MLIIPINTMISRNREQMFASVRRVRRAQWKDERRCFGRCVVRYVWGGEVCGGRYGGHNGAGEGKREKE